jgi:hypothetical protein
MQQLQVRSLEIVLEAKGEIKKENKFLHERFIFGDKSVLLWQNNNKKIRLTILARRNSFGHK